MEVKTGLWRRIFWIAAINLAIMITLMLLSQTKMEDMAGVMLLFVFYTFTIPLVYLMLSRGHSKKMYNLQILDPDEFHAPLHQWYVDTIKDVCFYAGMKKLPEIAIYKDHDINAFATGRSKNSSLVAVSSGLLQSMSPEATEAVIAHEVAHIMNGDMVTHTLVEATLKGLVAFFLLPITIMRWILFFSHTRENAWIFYLLFLIEAVITTILFFFVGLLTKAFSRSREFQADLLAAKLTHPQQIIRALDELDGNAQISRRHRPNMSRLFNGTSKFWDIFSTHPSIERRITYIKEQSFHSTKRQKAFVFPWKILAAILITAASTYYFTQPTKEPEAEAAPADITATADISSYLLKHSSTKPLTDYDISHLSPAELRIARNEIYARHGYPFQSSDLQQYFAQKSWYVRSDHLTKDSLSAVELANIQLIKESETNYFSDVDLTVWDTHMNQYATAMVEAINQRDYSVVAHYIKDGSSLEQAQVNLIQNLVKKEVTENVNYTEVRDVIQLSETRYRIIVFESIYVTKPASHYLTEHLWAYEAENEPSGLKLTKIHDY